MVIPAGYGQVNLIYTGPAIPTGAQVTFGIDNDGSQTAAAVAADVDAALVAAALMAQFVNDVAITTIHVKLGPDDTGPFADLTTNLVGTRTGTPLPPNTALLVKKVTDLGGRKGAGRMFFPGIQESDVGDDGSVLTPFFTNVQSALTTFLTGLASASIPMVLLHGDTTTPNTVTSVPVMSPVATQRRRLRR